MGFSGIDNLSADKAFKTFEPQEINATGRPRRQRFDSCCKKNGTKSLSFSWRICKYLSDPYGIKTVDMFFIGAFCALYINNDCRKLIDVSI